MLLTPEDVQKTARLARIRLTGQDVVEMREKLNGIFTWIDQLQQVNTDALPAFTDYLNRTMPERSDTVCDGETVDALLANAPQKLHGMFVVPKVVE